MSHLNYLPPRQQLPQARALKGPTFFWPSAVSLSLHLLLILLLFVIGRVQAQFEHDPAAGAMWIPTALLQQESQTEEPEPEPMQEKTLQQEMPQEAIQEQDPAPIPTETQQAPGEMDSPMAYPSKTAPQPKPKAVSTQPAVQPMVTVKATFPHFSSATKPLEQKPVAIEKIKASKPEARIAQVVQVPTPKPVTPQKQEPKKRPTASAAMTAPVAVVPPKPLQPPKKTPFVPSVPVEAKAAPVPPPPVPLKKEAPPIALARSSSTFSPPAGAMGTALQPVSVKQAPSPASATRTTEQQKLALPLPLAKVASAPQPLGVFDAPLSGDLQLEISGNALVGKTPKMVVLYRQYPRSKHKRPMSAAEARRVKTLVPLVARVRETAFQFAVDTAPDGIYEFRAQGNSPAVEGSCLVTIVTGDKRKVGKNIGTRRLNNSTVVKILMPEGLIWEDETAFTGTMEDSESITRYNSDTGLTWKEYKTD